MRLSRKKYARFMMHIFETMVPDDEQDLDMVSFSQRDAMGIVPHEDDPMVVKIHIRD